MLKHRFFISAIAFLFCAPAAHTQGLRLVAGVGVNASRGSYKGLNFVLDRYNETRQGQGGAAKVSRPMGNIHFTPGISWQLGLTLQEDEDEGFLLYMGINRVGRAASTYATVTDINGNGGRRDVRFTANSVNFEVAGGLRFDMIMLMLGGSLDYTQVNGYTRLNSKDYNRVMDDGNLGLSLFADVGVFITETFAISFKPSVQFVAIETDFTDLNKAINPATYSKDDYSTSSTTTNVGLQIQLRAFLGGD